MPERIELSRLRANGEAQARAVTDNAVIKEYAALMGDGGWDWERPDAWLTVFDDGESLWLSDGYHRYYAAQGAGLAEVACDVRQGTLRDAIWHSFSANACHGLRRTAADVRLILERIYQDPEWRERPDIEVARHTGIARRTVARRRDEYFGQLAKLADPTESQSLSGANPDQPATASPVKRGRGRPRGSGAATRKDPSAGQVTNGAESWSPSDIPPAAETPAPPPSPFAIPPRDTSNDFIHHRLRDALAAVDRLPVPTEAVRRYPIELAHEVDADEIKRAAKWLTRFADAWAGRAPEVDARQRHLDEYLNTPETSSHASH